MTIWKYLCLVLALVSLGVITVTEHVERVRVGYELRQLEREKRQLKQELKTRRMIWERLVAPEAVARRAVELQVISQAELETLPILERQESQAATARRGG